jgi:hypothetical protein
METDLCQRITSEMVGKIYSQKQMVVTKKLKELGVEDN